VDRYAVLGVVVDTLNRRGLDRSDVTPSALGQEDKLAHMMALHVLAHEGDKLVSGIIAVFCSLLAHRKHRSLWLTVHHTCALTSGST
jgi:NhaP-type Na+/H+ or K+/H+ antiporter